MPTSVKMLPGRSERGRFVKASVMFSVAKAECELGRVWFGLKITYEVLYSTVSKENLHILYIHASSKNRTPEQGLEPWTVRLKA